MSRSKRALFAVMVAAVVLGSVELFSRLVFTFRIAAGDLRHSHATMLLAQGVHPKVAQERLGHSAIGVTMDVYSHVLEGMQREATEKLDALFG